MFIARVIIAVICIVVQYSVSLAIGSNLMFEPDYIYILKLLVIFLFGFLMMTSAIIARYPISWESFYDEENDDYSLSLLLSSKRVVFGFFGLFLSPQLGLFLIDYSPILMILMLFSFIFSFLLVLFGSGWKK